MPAGIADAFGLGRVVACRVVTTGFMNLTWRLTTDRGEFAVKRLTDRSPEEFEDIQNLLPRLAERGFPVPLARRTPEGSALLKINNYRYAVSDWRPGEHPSGAALPLDACAGLGGLIARLHLTLGDLLPAAPTHLADTPASVDEARAALRHYAALHRRTAHPARMTHQEDLAGEIDRRLVLLDAIADRRPAPGRVGPCGWTHGDLQSFNLLMAGGRVTGILDWDRMGVRPYAQEVVRTATILFSDGGRTALDLDRTTALIRGYCARLPLTRAAVIDAAERRRWTLATETWQLQRHHDDGDSTCDRLFTARGRFLRWWTENWEEVMRAVCAGCS
ncbi:aminoglycoside phosphotransferase [Actinoplanes sp. SE50]|nr:aminoglycoside phosphotransferase [Actinoplanes sp. SE50/110]ATO84292.1 aminoglycoside phosphotransferase [Actinoplanes sp. SE50]SLM01702.1 hypothetical protein ACSP50_4940 [Actinoplanes sp. SE50/110]